MYHGFVLECNFQFNRAMIRSENILVNQCFFDLFLQLSANEKIIDSPTDISSSSIGEMTPPSIMPVAFSKDSKSINKSCINYFLDSLTLLGCESLLADIFLRASQVVFGMGHIEVSTKY